MTPKSQPVTIAIVGRPNVGKSTLFNRIVGRRRAIVGDESGITRDRLYGKAEWSGRRLRVVDTGGILPHDKELIPAEIFRQARVALEEADAVVMVVDGRTELAAPDLELSRLLMRTGKPLLLAVNKIDSPALEAGAENFRQLGIRNVYPISAEHGGGVAELLDAVLEGREKDGNAESVEEAEDAEETDAGESLRLRSGQAPDSAQEAAAREVKVAIIGRPNVGKSTLLNQLAGSARAIVSPIPGTTRDAVDERIERDGHVYRLIDTAGIRRKGKTKLMAEKLSVVMARKHLEAADVALLVIDALDGVTAVDAHIAGYAHESGRSVIVLINKWDLAGPGRADGKRPADRELYERQARAALKFMPYAPILFISATSEKYTLKIFATLATVAAERRKRIPTAEMNRFLKRVDFDRAGVPASKKVKVYYMTQAQVAPPTFVLFTDRAVKLHFSYQRFLENQIRKAFGFMGTPIWIKVIGKGDHK
jgi:GTP-binding protein